MLRVEDTIGRCPRCRARMRVARVFDRRNNIVPYVSRCEGCSYQHRGELDYGLLAKAFSVPRAGEPGGNDVGPDEACPECAENNADLLVWIDEERVECQVCRTVYKPGGGDDEQH